MGYAFVAAFAFLTSTSFAQFQKKKIEIPNWENAVRFELVASQSPVRPGDSLELALLAEIQEGYHLYGPEEPEPTRTSVSLQSPALKPGKPSYPPLRFIASSKVSAPTICMRVRLRFASR